jgi:hypothetical protein
VGQPSARLLAIKESITHKNTSASSGIRIYSAIARVVKGNTSDNAVAVVDKCE